MKLHLPQMALLNHPLQWVPVRVRRQTLLACQIAAPGFYQAGVERVALHSHLKEDGVDAIPLQIVQLTDEHGLHAVTTDVLELSVDCLNPSSTKLSLGILSHRCRCHKEQHNK